MKTLRVSAALGLTLLVGADSFLGVSSAKAASFNPRPATYCEGGISQGYDGLRIAIVDVVKARCTSARSLMKTISRKFYYLPDNFSASTFRCKRYSKLKVSSRREAYLCVWGVSRVVFTAWTFEGD